MLFSDSRRTLQLVAFLFVIAGGLTSLSPAAAPARRAHAKRTAAAQAAAPADSSNTPAALEPAGPAAAPAAATAVTSAGATVTAAKLAVAGSTATQAAAPQVAVIPAGQVPASIYKEFAGKKFGQGPISEKIIALTFDDGPSPVLTPQVMAILKSNNVPATFFMLGQEVQRFPSMAKAVADAGYEVACHSITHPNMQHMDEARIRQEIVGSADIVEQATGKRPHLFRPPFGNINAAMRAVCQQNDMVIVHWSIDPRDWNAKSTPDSVVQQAVKQARGGGIVCIHDVHARTIAALPRIISELRAQGYQFVTISQMLAEADKHKSEMPALGGEMGGGMGAAPMPAAKPAAIPLSQSGIK